jgi:UDP:flavonoid glycosyltransferase YjiC (YdhE family)
LAALDITVVVATAGKKFPDAIPTNAYVAQFLPGEEAARLACLVICNGGSPTSQQALAVGTPMIGIASNLDQFLNMEAIQRAGAGEILRADRFSRTTLATLVTKILRRTEYTAAARRIGAISASYDSGARFATIVRDVLRTVVCPVSAAKKACS